MNDEKIKEFDAKLANDIKNHGLQVLHVFGDYRGPAFSYSIGLFKSYGHPEIIIVGLSEQLAHILINNMAFDIKGGKVYTPLKYEAGVLDNFDCYFIEVEKINYDEYVGSAQGYYGNDDFPLLQCIYPTTKGIYPWQPEWPDSKDLQPILGSING